MLLLLPLSWAGSLSVADRPLFPFRSAAGEDGVHVLYQNPSLLSYDRDAMYGAYFDTINLQTQNLSIATTGNGLGLGVGYRSLEGGLSWWSLSTGFGLKLDRAVSIGLTNHWQLPDGGDNNFVSWDLGLGWRPAPFFGMGGAIQNLGNPSPDLGVFTRYTAGAALRPTGDTLTFGLDWAATAPPSDIWDHHAVATLRVRPTRGLWVRLYADQGLTDLSSTEIGGALEIHVGDIGYGVSSRAGLGKEGGDIGAGVYVATTPENDNLFAPQTTVAEFDFDSPHPYQPLPGQGESYLTMLRRLETATRDPQVRGILLKIDALDLSYAQIEEVRALLQVARNERKPVVAFLGQDASTRAYFLASACDNIYLHPAASLDLVGISAEMMYYKGAMDLIGIEAQYAKRAEYKSGPEPYTRTDASEPAREEMNVLLDDIFGTIVTSIADGRGMKVEDVRTTIDSGPFTAKEAVERKLVDGLVYPDELNRTLANLFTGGFNRDDEYQTDPDMSGWMPERAVAVIIVDGAITSGPSSPGGFLSGSGTGSETVIQQLAQARRSESVKAVVLRVDSPGGSAFASDEIWREVARLRESGKPVIVSMGGYAASGGYYVSAGADRILALPSTVTGSIGIYGGKYSGAELLDTLHITTESYLRGRNSGMFSVYRPFDPVEFAALDKMIAAGYAQFKEKVAQGRSLTDEQVEEVARGRVWSGTRASENGLVDQIGGFFDAVDIARREAGIGASTPYSLITYDPWMGSPGYIPAVLIQALAPRAKLPPELAHLIALSVFQDERIFAMMPYYLEIH